MQLKRRKTSTERAEEAPPAPENVKKIFIFIKKIFFSEVDLDVDGHGHSMVMVGRRDIIMIFCFSHAALQPHTIQKPDIAAPPFVALRPWFSPGKYFMLVRLIKSVRCK